MSCVKCILNKGATVSTRHSFRVVLAALVLVYKILNCLILFGSRGNAHAVERPPLIGYDYARYVHDGAEVV